MLKIENTEIVGWNAAIRGMRNPMNSWNKSDSGFGCEEVTGSHRFCSECDDAIYIRDACSCGRGNISGIVLGLNDYDLMNRLRNSGTDHRKFMRMITVYLDITAPLYWWKEFKTYRAGRKFGDDEPGIIDEGYLEYDIEMNSCSTMHKIGEKEFTLDDFSCEHLMSFEDSNYWEEDSDNACFIDPGKKEVVVAKSLILNYIIPMLNVARGKYNEIGQKLKESDLTDAERKHLVAQQKLFWWQMIQLLPSSYNQKRTVMLNYEVLANMYRSRRNHKLDEWHTFCDWIEDLPYSELITGRRGEN